MNNIDNTNFDDSFDEQLLRWHDGDLQGQELSDFEADPRFIAYQQIREGAKGKPLAQADQDTLLLKIKGHINDKPSSVNETTAKVIPLWKKMAGIAAVAVTIFGVLTLFSPDISVNSHHAIQLSHALPDGSQVVLNSDSELAYDDNFPKERKLSLDGEAFFEVEKGKSFTVVTDEGEVAVLGTSFNILTREGAFVVSCKTGKVKVTSQNKSETITQGERIRFSNGTPLAVEKINPLKIDSWTSGESYFERAPLQEVITSISHKYDISINLPTVHHNRLYTGSFIHSDIEKALKMVLSPIGIKYEVGASSVVKIY